MSKELDLGWAMPQLGALQRHEVSGIGTGLCRAIATRLGVDVTLIRVLFIVFGLSAGLGVALYIWGTALTYSGNGRRPIDTLAPGFARWPLVARAVAILGTTVVTMLAADSVAPLPWGAGVLLLAVLIVVARRRAGEVNRWVAPPSGRAVGQSDEALIEEWRRVMSAAAGPAAPSQLPVVDLYSSPDPQLEPAPERPAPSWIAGLSIAAAALIACVGTLVMGLDPRVSFGAALATAGVLSAVFAVVARRRRLPRLLVFLLAFTLVPAGWLAIQASQPERFRAYDSSVLVERVVARESVIDLTGADLTGVSQIRVTAIASEVTVKLPGPPIDVQTRETLSTITVEGQDTGPALDVQLVVDATLSEIRLVTP